jgi:DNA-binding NtrC family response regulator
MTQTRKTQIVVVDSDLEIQELISAFFKPKGFQVICFTDANEAIKESLNTENHWDVLLSNLRFPKISGVEFTVQIKKSRPDLPIIFITPPETAESALETIKKGAYDLIVKPIHFPHLQIAVDRALQLQELKGDISELRKIVKSNQQSKIIGRSPNFLKALDVAKRVAKSSANIFISGESGTGKEVFAKFIHSESRQSKGPLVAINCSSIPETLLESELFGHAKGSFTGAHAKKIGLFEEAENGTLFLDEIGDLSLVLQAKLLRVLQEKKIRRVGENTYKAINCRIISATHKNLSKEVGEKRFREDLYFRLNVIPIAIPALRERQEDLMPLAESFLRKFSLENGSSAKSFSKEAIKFILENQWRGNVRELENTVERSVVLCGGTEISLENFMPLSANLNSSQTMEPADVFQVHCGDALPSLEDIVHKYIEYAIKRNNGARDKTAKDIGIDRKTLYKRTKESMN